MENHPHRSEHIAYSTDGGDLRSNEYELRWKQKAAELVKSVQVSGQRLSVMDFGSGRGEFLAMLRSADIDCVGVDLDPKCVELSSQFAPSHQADIDGLMGILPGQQFDVVTAIHVLEHLEKPKEAVLRLAERSRRWLVLAVPNLAMPVALVTKHIKECNQGHLQGWDAGHFKNFLESKCGLHIRRWSADQVILPKVSRALEKFRLRRYLEYELLPRRYPFLSQSLIVLCEK